MGINERFAKGAKCSCDLCSFINAEPVNIEKHGARLLTVRIKVKNVCLDKKVAVAVIIYDDCNRILAFKGFITMAFDENQCDKDACGTIERKVVFVLPDNDEFEPSQLNVRTIANYIYPCEKIR